MLGYFITNSSSIILQESDLMAKPIVWQDNRITIIVF